MTLDLMQAERRGLLAGTTVLVLTSIHHAYGAFRYGTPWRYHVVVFAAGALVAMLVALQLSRSRPAARAARVAWWAFWVVTATIPVLLIGGFEGLYNHVLKVALFLGGVSVTQLRHLYPSGLYEMPNDGFFEFTGVLQVIPAGVTAYYLVLLLLMSQRLRRTSVDPRPTLVSNSYSSAEVP
jgi:hypothetical protein